MVRMVLERRPAKGVWGSRTTRSEHFGVVLETGLMRFFVTTCYEKPHLLEGETGDAPWHGKVTHEARRTQSHCQVQGILFQSFLGSAIQFTPSTSGQVSYSDPLRLPQG